jgi:hypothetical protein
MDASKLIGTWRLRSVKNFGPDGSVVDAFGPEPVGYIIYTDEGRMAVEMMADPAADARNSYTSYAGRFEVHSDPDRVFHLIEACAIREWVGKREMRSVSVDGDLLALEMGPVEMAGREHRIEILWDRVRA